MNRDAVIRILQPHLGELAERYGVKSLALFGSVARDEATGRSDVDLLVEFDRPIGLFGLFALQDHLETQVFKPLGRLPAKSDQILRDQLGSLVERRQGMSQL